MNLLLREPSAVRRGSSHAFLGDRRVVADDLGGESPAASASSTTVTSTRVPLMHGCPWHTSGSIEISSRSSSEVTPPVCRTMTRGTAAER